MRFYSGVVGLKKKTYNGNVFSLEMLEYNNKLSWVKSKRLILITQKIEIAFTENR